MPKTWTSGPVSEFELAVAGEVKAWMGRRGLSARQLADKIGMAHSALSKRLRGVSAFTINDLGVIAAHMGITLGQLLGPVVDVPLTGEDTENPAPASPERGETDEDVRPVGLEPTTHGLKDPSYRYTVATTFIVQKILSAFFENTDREAN